MEQLVTACLELGVVDKKFIELSHQRCYGWRNLFFPHFQQLESFVVNEIVMNLAGQHRKVLRMAQSFFFSHFQQLESFVVNEIVMNPAGQHRHVFSPTPAD